MTDRVIREATAEDRPAVVRILREITATISPDAPDAERTDEYLLSIIDSCKVFILTDGADVVGMNAIRILDFTNHPRRPYKKAAFIMAIGAAEGRRRQGVGTSLVDHMLQWFEAEGIEFVSLNVAAHNEAALRFYEKMGFLVKSLSMGRDVKLCREQRSKVHF